jgi:hypothetical protein
MPQSHLTQSQWPPSVKHRCRAIPTMVTKPINAWDLDEYVRPVHHLWAYYAGKIETAIGSGDETTLERYTGKLALLSDKVVAMCKVRALWKANDLKIEPEGPPEPDPIEQLDNSKLKQKFLAKKAKLEARLKIERARRQLSDIEEEIQGELDMIALNINEEENEDHDRRP